MHKFNSYNSKSILTNQDFIFITIYLIFLSIHSPSTLFYSDSTTLINYLLILLFNLINFLLYHFQQIISYSIHANFNTLNNYHFIKNYYSS